MKTSQRNKAPQIRVFSPLDLQTEDFQSLAALIRKKKKKLLILALLPDRSAVPSSLNSIRAMAEKRGSGLRVVWKKDAQNSQDGTLAAIQSSEEFRRAREIAVIAPGDWQRNELQSLVERLPYPGQTDQHLSDFKPSRFSIRRKLLLITGLIVSLSLTSMILVASYLFRNHSETLIQGYNLSLARLVAESLDKDIQGIEYRCRALLDRIASEQPSLPIETAVQEEEEVSGDSPDPDSQANNRTKTSQAESSDAERRPDTQAKAPVDRQTNSPAHTGENSTENKPGNPEQQKRRAGHGGYESVQRFFQENNRYLYIARLDTEKRELVQEFYNDAFFREYNLGPENFRRLLESWPGGAESPLAVQSFSAGDVPALGFSFSGSEGRIIVFLAADDFFQSFRKARQAGLFEIHLISPDGQVLVSSDEDGTSRLQGNEILKEVIGSPVDNGSRKYINQGQEYLASFQALPNAGLTVLSHAQTGRVFEAVRRIERQNLYLMGAVLASAFLLVFLFARTLSVPIVRLARATGAVGRGDYSVRIEPTTRDEIGQLTHSFLLMTRGLQEREHIKEAFGKFVSPDIAERALRGEIKLGGERRTGTVFFSDLRNFTGLSEKRQPEEVVDFLNRYFTVMVDCIQSHGGVVDKFIGDAIMAHWGTLAPSATDTADAIRAALDMRQSLLVLNAEFEKEGVPPLRFGCGINTGPVIAGQIGSEKRLEYTVIGDTVNLASRIEYLNKLFGTDILISSYTMQQVRGLFEA
ncbi:MAG: HAMP domain-containing protein, partial [Leptospiraceae bacterium]|nr:HAMP domain-containing protein [Leptospiraceae bacterium]